MDDGRVDGGAAREDAAQMARRDRLVDSAVFVVAVIFGAAFFSNQARQSDLPQWAVLLGTFGGLRSAPRTSGR